MPVKFSNLATTTLSSGIDASTTSVDVADASVFPSISGAEYFYLTIGEGSGSEIIKVTSVSSNTLTVTRGQDSTSAASHSTGATVALRMVAAALVDLGTTLAYSGSAKVQATSAGCDVTGDLTATGDVTAYSDARLKESIQTLDGSAVFRMRGVEYTKDGRPSSGVIAQELEQVAPELVHDDGHWKSVAYGNLTGYLIEAIKLQQAEINELRKKIHGDSL